MLKIDVFENSFPLQINDNISMWLTTALDFKWRHLWHWISKLYNSFIMRISKAVSNEKWHIARPFPSGFNKHLKNTKLYSIQFLRTEMTSDPYGSYSLFQYSFVCFKCFIIHRLGDWNQSCTLSLLWGQFCTEKIHGELTMCIINEVKSGSTYTLLVPWIKNHLSSFKLGFLNIFSRQNLSRSELSLVLFLSQRYN